MIVCRNTIKEMTVNSIQISGPVGGAEKQIPGLRNGQVERNRMVWAFRLYRK